MNPIQPIDKWKFNVQIIVAIIIFIIYVVRGTLYINYNIKNVSINTLNANLWYFSTAGYLILLGFQVLLFRPIPKIKKLFLAVTILFVVGIVLRLLQKLFNNHLTILQMIDAMQAIHELSTLVVNLVLFISMLLKKFDEVPVIKLLRTYAIVSIIVAVFQFLWPLVLLIFPLAPSLLFWRWGMQYYLIVSPLIFLIIAYFQLKSVSPEQLYDIKNEI